MASLTYDLALNKGKGAADYSNQGVDADGDGVADRIDEDGDGELDDLYVPAAPGIDPFVAKACKTPKPTSLDCYRPTTLEDDIIKDVRIHTKFMPGYGGYVPKEMVVKTEGGQWSPPHFLNVANKEGPTPYMNLGANQPPGPGAPPRSVVFSRDGVFVEGGPAMRKAGTNLI